MPVDLSDNTVGLDSIWSGFEEGASDLRLLPNGRLGRITKVRTRCGKPVFRGCDGKLLCRHGEMASFILTRNSKSGKCVPVDDLYACDCRTTDGLFTKDDTPAAPMTTDLFRLLKNLGAEQASAVDCKTESVHYRAFGDLWINSKNKIVCKHGRGPVTREKTGCCDLRVPKRRHSALSFRMEKSTKHGTRPPRGRYGVCKLKCEEDEPYYSPEEELQCESVLTPSTHAVLAA